MISISQPCSIDWEIRVCYWDLSYELWFQAEGTGDPMLVQKSEGMLQATDGIVRGSYAAAAAGTLKCSFINNGAWFKSRFCLGRAEQKV